MTNMAKTLTVLLGAAFTTLRVTSFSVLAQALKDVQTPDAPLVLKAQGSFFVLGDVVVLTKGDGMIRDVRSVR